jgi:hypothetical protein
MIGYFIAGLLTVLVVGWCLLSSGGNGSSDRT